MLPIHKIVWHEWREKRVPQRVPEPEAMVDPEQIRAYVKAYEWGGPTSALQLHHLRELGAMIKPGDIVLDMACGPGPLLLELAALYPDVSFVGADLSQPMLDAMLDAARVRQLSNVSAVCQDITTLPGVQPASVDMVISTSALHHLPDLHALDAAFGCIQGVLKPGGGIYIFDFGLLKSTKTQDIMVAEVAKLAPKITVIDYQNSLRAAFQISDVVECAKRRLDLPFKVKTSSFVDFFYFLQSSPRCEVAPGTLAYLARVRHTLDFNMKAEYSMLRLMRRELAL